jgi:phosphate-selective porin OprO/OprP
MMTNSKFLTALLAGSALALAAPAFAQEDVVADTPPPSAEEVAAQTEFLKAQVEALQDQLEALKKQVNLAQPSWKGAPQWTDKDAGWSFKLRGRLMYDAAYIDNPGLTFAQTTGQLGFNSRVRRARLGVEGNLPGGFNYKAEADFANSAVSWADVFVEYKPGNSPFSARVGHFETFQSLEQITSSRHIMFLERAQMNDAFGHARRLGAAQQ